MDIFARARIKIAFFYLIIGAVILVIAGYLVYSDLTAIIRSVLALVQQILAGAVPADQGAAAATIANAIDAQVRQMDLTVGIWLIVAMMLSAYFLAGITLRPVRRAMERQKRFMANISHELRTPLSVMKTNTEATLLAAQTLTHDELMESVSSNLEEVDRMANIIEFLLGFADIENRLARFEFAPVDLVEAARKAAGLVRRMAEEKRVSLVIAAAPSAVVAGNGTAIEEMIVNLVRNAITYTPSGGSVTVRVTRGLRGATVAVEDTGAGIPEKDLPNIFEAFYRGENAAVVKKDGGSIGLGLAIVKEIAAFHGASVSAESALGKGTTVCVRFPGKFTRWFALT